VPSCMASTSKAVKSAAPISITEASTGDWAWRGGVGRGAGVCLGL
jgi:hypothetical protein